MCKKVLDLFWFLPIYIIRERCTDTKHKGECDMSNKNNSLCAAAECDAFYELVEVKINSTQDIELFIAKVLELAANQHWSTQIIVYNEEKDFFVGGAREVSETVLRDLLMPAPRAKNKKSDKIAKSLSIPAEEIIAMCYIKANWPKKDYIEIEKWRKKEKSRCSKQLQDRYRDLVKYNKFLIELQQ